MKKRLMMALATGALMAGMLPAVASADWVVTPEDAYNCGTTTVTDPSEIGSWVLYYRELGICGPVRVVRVAG